MFEIFNIYFNCVFWSQITMGIDKLLTVPSCYGFSLATGGLIIGYFELFTNGLSILFSTKEPTSVLYILDGRHIFLFTFIVTHQVNKFIS